MDHFDRIMKMHQLFKSSYYPITRKKFEKELRCSRATVKRQMNILRNYLHAPIEYDKGQNGYYYDKESQCKFELPGLWFNASELQALVIVQHLLSEIQPGLLEPHIAPLKKRIEKLLKSNYTGKKDISEKVRLLGMGVRHTNQDNFQQVADAVIRQKQIEIIYHSRSKNRKTARTLSPQRVIHYRDNWYLDAWDHDKQALRSFAIERIEKITRQNKAVKKVSIKKLEQHFSAAYGIFAGKPKYTAVLKFDSDAARWVAEETWHPKQECEFKDRHYILRVPYSDSRELVMDILKYGSRVEVLEPKGLKNEIKAQLQKTLKQYQ